MKNLQPISNRSDPARGSSLAHMKSQQLARDDEENIRRRRLKGTMVLIEEFLLEQGYTQTLQQLQQESGVSLTQFSVADNIDLLSVIKEYEDFYELKTQRRPKLFRVRDGQGGEETNKKLQMFLDTRRDGKRDNSKKASSSPSSAPTYASAGGAASPADAPQPPAHLRPTNLSRALADHHQQQQQGSSSGGPTASPSLALEGKLVSTNAATGTGNGAKKTTTKSGAPDGGDDDGEDGENIFNHRRALKPLPQFPTNELNDLAATIMREILEVNPNVRWSDIAELDKAKHLLKEAVVMPVKYPQLFEGIVRPWKGILLFGPPGTGKTLLAKAVATECKTTFFNISASSVVSKWRGDSEKLVRMLFELAIHYAPSTIFIDEIDSLMSSRSGSDGGGGGEHEGSRRLKTELLTQLDGLSRRKGGQVVFVLAASNLPWDLDTAMLRRLEKRVLVALPSFEARRVIFHRLLRCPSTTGKNTDGGSDADATMIDLDECAHLTEGMSGADIDILCREAMMRPIRQLIAQLEAAGDDAKAVGKLSSEAVAPRVTMDDVVASVQCTRSSVRQGDLVRYAKWEEEYGSSIST